MLISTIEPGLRRRSGRTPTSKSPQGGPTPK
jgi:hypothetical protein